MATEEDLDGGSDLSSVLSEPTSGVESPAGPLTPGVPSTPRTYSPQPMEADLPPAADSFAPAIGDAPPPAPPMRRSSSRMRPQRQQSGEALAASGPSRDAGPNASQHQKRGSTARYEYTTEPHRNVFEEETKVEGKRARRQPSMYSTNGDASNPAIRRQSAQPSTSRDREEEVGKAKRVKKEAVDAAVDAPASVPSPMEQSTPRPRVTLKIIVKRNRSTRSGQIAQEGTEGLAVEQAPSAGHTDPQDQTKSEEEEEEEIVTRKKRPNLGSSVANPPDGENPVASNRKRSHPRSMHGKRRGEKRRRPTDGLKKQTSSTKLHAENSHDDDYAAEEASEDEAMTDDADEDRQPEVVRLKDSQKKSKRPALTKQTNRKGQESKIASLPAKNYAESAPIVATSSASVGGGGEFTSSPSTRPPVTTQTTSQATPVRPPAKSFIRKSTGSSVLANLMGYSGGSASGSRDNTPSRSVNPRPRPPVSAVRPNGTASNTARPPPGALSQQKRVGESAGVNGVTSASTAENPGLTGKHVTAEQMAVIHDEEVFAHANPSGLFDLLHGAELMMEFEEETRQRMGQDMFLHKHKLYRPGRTDAMWRLVERIKASEGRV